MAREDGAREDGARLASAQDAVTRLSLIAILAVGIVTAIVFAAWPRLDMAIALFFHDPQTQARLAAFRPAIEGVRDGASWVIGLIAAVAVVALVGKVAFPARRMLIPGRAALLMIVTILLGPALLVNTILKPHWPRPRPGAVHELGGPLPFMPWWDPRGGCDSNCSFVSGEVSGAAWTLAPAALTPPPWRAPAVAAALVFTAVIAGVRIVQGGHFTSDTLFAASFTALIVWLIFGALYRWGPMRITDAAVEDWFGRLGTTLRRLASRG